MEDVSDSEIDSQRFVAPTYTTEGYVLGSPETPMGCAPRGPSRGVP
jgi:hypothetical protein